MIVNNNIRTYQRSKSVVFRKTKEAFGGLSNMAGGYPLEVKGIRILSSEALYQACRYPHMPDIQRLIIGQRSPMTAKMRTKPYRKQSRQDWDQVRLKIMRWCLRVKLAQNWSTFGQLLLQTGDKPIVEDSNKDDFWGAKPLDDGTLVGTNALGRLLMELREDLRSYNKDILLHVEPLSIPEFLLMGNPISVINVPIDAVSDSSSFTDGQEPARLVSREKTAGDDIQQASLFEQQTSESAESGGVVIIANSLEGYRVEKKAAIKIILPDEDSEVEPVPTSGGGRKAEPEIDKLSNIIKTFNDQFGNINWSDEDRVNQLITKEIPARVAADSAYKNAIKNSDRQNARIEHDKALLRVMTALLKDDTELFKQFSDNDSFRRWLTDTVFDLTYE